MLSNAWQTVTLNRFALSQWREVSLLHRVLSFARSWRQGSVLLQWGDTIALVIVAILFALAPYVPTSLIGVLLVACSAFWWLLTLTDEAGEGLTPIHLVVMAYWGVMVLATALSPVRGAAIAGLIKLTLNVLLFFADGAGAAATAAPHLTDCGVSVNGVGGVGVWPAPVVLWGRGTGDLG